MIKKYNKKRRQEVNLKYWNSSKGKKKRQEFSQKFLGKNNPNYKKGKTLNSHYCKFCQKQIDKQGRSIACHKCKGNLYKGNKNPAKKLKVRKKISQKLKNRKITWSKKISENRKGINIGHKCYRGKFEKHHIYLKENSKETMRISSKKHHPLHMKAYEYIYKKFGKKEIDSYIKWFDKKYGIIKSRKKEEENEV